MPIKPKRVRRKRRHQVSWLRNLQLRSGLVISIFVVLGFGVGLLAFSSARKGWTRWHKASLLATASDRLEHNQIAEAESIARKALAIDPNSLVAARILAESTEKQNRAETVAWRAQIARLDPGLDSQLNLASAALRFGQLDVARDALARVAPVDHDKAPFHVVAGWLSRAQGNIAEEERHFAAAVAQEPKNDVYQFNLAVLQIHSPDPEKNTAARNQLERLSKVTQFRTEALRALLDNALRQNQTDAANELAQALQMSPQVTFSDYLLCLDLYRKLSPQKFDALIDKVKPVAARDSRDLAQLLSWMNKNGLASSALKWSDKLPADLTSKPPVASAIAESLARTKNWSRLKRWTRNGSWGNDEYLRLAYQAYAARRSRRTVGEAEAEFDALWNSAEGAARDNPEREVALARLASAWELAKEAEQLWLRVAKVPATRREALDALYALYRASNDLPNLHRIAQRLHESSPEEVGLAANAARFALLLDRNTADGRTLAQQVYEKAPNDTAAALTYAFALYGTGRTAEAVEILKKLPPEQLEDPHAAVYAALLFDDAGQSDLANKYLALAKGGKIFPEEKQLLEEIATRRQNVGAPPNEVSPTPAPRPSSKRSSLSR
ncbi:MAG: tetratricopeptide repeat protein [Chthoniobacterales bacterium]